MMKHLFSLLLVLCLGLCICVGASAESAAFRPEEAVAFASELKEQAMQSQLLNDPTDEDALSEDGYALSYSFATLYADRPEMTAETVLSAAMITDSAFSAPRGIQMNTHYPELLAAFRNDNPSLNGSREGALLYLEGDVSSGYIYGQALRDGQRIRSIEYGAFAPSGDGYTRIALTFSIEMDLVSAIRLEGLSETADASAAAELFAGLQSLGAETGYIQYLSSWNGLDLTPFDETDLSFSGLSFLTLQPENLGSLAEDVLVSNDEDGWLRVVNTNDYSATFTCREDGSEARIAYLELLSDDVEGPRGVRLGDSISMDLNRFRHGETEPSESGSTEVLYGTEGTAPWGKAYYLDGDGMTLRYVTAAGGREVELYLHYVGSELSEIRLSAK